MGGAGPLSSELLFVYGTLRGGGPADVLLRGTQPLGTARYRGRLYDLGDYPGVVRSEDPADVVHGELYALPREDGAALLARLDRYEGPEFLRTRAVVTLASGDRRESWIYLYARDATGLRQIASGIYRTDPAG